MSTKRELELKFTAGKLKHDAAGLVIKSNSVMAIEQQYLRYGWRARRWCADGDLDGMSESGTHYELNKKNRTGQTSVGVDSQETEFDVPQAFFKDLTTDWRHPDLAPVRKFRRTLTVNSSSPLAGLRVEYDSFAEAWVLYGAMYLVEVEYNPKLTAPTAIIELVGNLFEEVRNVSDDSRFTNGEIARRIAEHRGPVPVN